jgi:hypothetical protein
MTNPSQPPPSNQPSQVIISQLPDLQQWTGTLKTEDPLEKEYRLKNENYDARHKRWRGTVLFVAVSIGLMTVFIYCFQIINNSNATVDDKKWATAIMTSIVTGGLGYATGKATT